MQPTQTDDSAFRTTLEAALSGDPDAWSGLYGLAAPRILRYLRSRSVDDPEDVLGDVFLRIVDKLGSFSGTSEDFVAWAIGIAHNRMVDVIRARDRRPSEPVEPSRLQVEEWGGDVEDEASVALATERVRETLDLLSPDQRDVMYLRIIAGLSLEQTARALGKKVGAVKALQARSVAAIRRGIEGKAVSL